jgi:hypothetical protein
MGSQEELLENISLMACMICLLDVRLAALESGEAGLGGPAGLAREEIWDPLPRA